jgi:hypothetical protein
MLIFLEATLHTTMPWKNWDHPRRSLLYRYSPKYLNFAGDSATNYTQPDWVKELTPEQQAVLEHAYSYDRPELDNIGQLEGYELQDGERVMQRKAELLSNADEVPYVIATERGKFAPTVPTAGGSESAAEESRGSGGDGGDE